MLPSGLVKRRKELVHISPVSLVEMQMKTASYSLEKVKHSNALKGIPSHWKLGINGGSQERKVELHQTNKQSMQK